jgi:hydantoinase/carbamoylase family amidase
MAARRDALAGAAAMVLAIEALAQDDGEGLVATVGAIEAAPGAINVIPGGASFTIDLRAPTNAHRDHALETLEGRLRAIAEQRGLAVALRRDYETAAVAMDEGVIARLERAIERTGLSARRLFSGAGHDAMAMTALCPAAMLFVRCAGGISHNPAESITASDAGHAVRANLQFLLDWGAGRERG